MSRRFYSPNNAALEPNTIIGGIGSTINTKFLLATTLGIDVFTIRQFDVVGTEVRANISLRYNIKLNAFKDNVDITSFLDLEGKANVPFAGVFQNTKIENVFLPAASSLGQSTFENTPNFLNVLYGGVFETIVTGLPTNVFKNSAIPKVSIPNATIIGDSSFLGTGINQILNSGNVTSIGNTGCYASGLTVLDVSNVVTLGEQAMRGTKVPILDFPKLTSIGGLCFRQATTTHLYMNKLEEVSVYTKTNLFYQMGSLVLLEMKKLKVFGDASQATNPFFNLKVDCMIRVNIALATTNAGAPDAALVWAKVNRSSIVEFYDNNGVYISTL